MGTKLIIEKGKKYNLLTAIEDIDKRDKKGQRVWLFKCDCGNLKEITATRVITNSIKSCGCLGGIHHGLASRKNRDYLYKIYHKMKQRCLNHNNARYSYYGGRGIYICDEWLDKNVGLKNFRSWSLENGWEKGLEIDRIDNDGPYAPWNCRWTTRAEQNKNTRQNRYIEINGEKLVILDAIRKYSKVNPTTVYKRLSLGYTMIESIFNPPIKNGVNK